MSQNRSFTAPGSPEAPAALQAGDLAPSDASSGLGPVLSRILSALDEIRARLAGVHKDLYTIAEVAKLTGRSDYTVRRWVKEGRLDATRVDGTGPRGRLLVSRDQIRRLIAAGKGGSVPEIGGEQTQPARDRRGNAQGSNLT